MLFFHSISLLIFLLNIYSHIFQLLDLGIVYKENFDAEEDSKFHLDTYANEKRENATIKERREREEKSKEDSSKAYDEWLQLKSMKDAAIKYLGLLTLPVLIVNARDMGIGVLGGGGGGGGGNGSIVAWSSSSKKMDEGVSMVIEVLLVRLFHFIFLLLYTILFCVVLLSSNL